MSAPTTAPPLDIAEVALDGTVAIEASAGTGKTHTITRLYLRLVVEKALPVDRILVVTYTVAATAELRSRVRELLASVANALAERRIEDELLSTLIERVGRAVALRRVEDALRGFDQAAIFTIHGFCQRVLAEKAFESGMPFRTELLADETDLLREIAEDFWRREFYDATPLFATWLVEKRLSPDGLLESIADFVGKPYLQPLAPPPRPDAAELEARYRSAHARAAELWHAERAPVCRFLTASPALWRRLRADDPVSAWTDQLDALFAIESPPVALPDAALRLTEEKVRAAVKPTRATPRFELFAALGELGALRDALCERYEQLVKQSRVDLLAHCRRELERRKLRLRVQSYDDLLLHLSDALERDPGGGLVRAIRERYPAALIDEFQDTDPVQYRIFRTVYHGAGLPAFYVGDPKQAIYSFRGADIFAYLGARGDADRRHRLDRNWRSDRALVAAVNCLFERSKRPMLFDEIPFQPAVAAERERAPLVVEGDPPEPFTIRLLARQPGEKLIKKGHARDLAARTTAAEVARLLDLGARGKARVGDRPLGGGDIAVLVRTNHEAKLVRRELLRLRVPSVQQAMESVFATREALELERLLLAIATPGSESRLRAALATEMLGVSADELQRLQEAGGDPEWEERAGRMRAHHQLWRDHGFARMFRAALIAEDVAPRLLAYADGSRRLTNLLHLGELLAEAEIERRLGIDSLLRWLADRRSTASIERDERIENQQLRLESDENLVKIVTIHKSKGLQYEVVFCPFLWDGRLYSTAPEARGKPFLFHDPETGVPTLELGSEQESELRAFAAREEIAEKLRLLYVALTRAHRRCVLTWGAIRDADTSAPAWLLHAPQGDALPTPAEVAKRFAGLSDDALLRDLEGVVARSDRTIRIEAIADQAGRPFRPAAQDARELRARVLRRPLPEALRVASFSSLIAAREAWSTRAPRLAEEGPDHDASARPAESAIEAAAERTIFTFPRGVRAGSCLHAILEELDFTAVDRTSRAARVAAIAPLVERKLAAHGFEAEWNDVVTAAIERAVVLPLDAAGQIRLAGLPAARAARELEFTYPVSDLSAAGLRAALVAHELAGGRFATDLATLAFPRLAGFMKGFIDLVFEHGGRFYVLDYKSNHLGDRSEDYAPERLAAAVGREGYYLQYLIYVLTMHRLLRLRLPDYDPTRHLGGVFYVFLRGLDASAPPGWSVFHDRPPPELVLTLDRLIGGEAANAAGGRA